MMFTRAELLEMLHNGTCTVTFTKVKSGEKRVMPCTLNESLLPPAPKIDETKQPKKENLDTIRVFCHDKNEWRSFRVDNVIDIIAD